MLKSQPGPQINFADSVEQDLRAYMCRLILFRTLGCSIIYVNKNPIKCHLTLPK